MKNQNQLKKIFQNKKVVIISLISLVIIVILSLGYWVFTSRPATFYELKSLVSETPKVEKDVVPVSGDFGLVIPEIGVNYPVVPDVDGLNPDDYLWKVTEGVAHFKHSELSNLIVDGAYPGETGNIFLFAHSQIPGGDMSKYQGAFNDLPGLKAGDSILMYYKNQKYEYVVTDSKIIEKTDLHYLEKTDKETLHLMTCWPLGFNNRRYLVTAVRESDS